MVGRERESWADGLQTSLAEESWVDGLLTSLGEERGFSGGCHASSAGSSCPRRESSQSSRAREFGRATASIGDEGALSPSSAWGGGGAAMATVVV